MSGHRILLALTLYGLIMVGAYAWATTPHYAVSFSLDGGVTWRQYGVPVAAIKMAIQSVITEKHVLLVKAEITTKGQAPETHVVACSTMDIAEQFFFLGSSVK